MKKINLNVPINSLGYGVVGYNVWKRLNETYDVTLWPIPDSNHVIPPVEPKDDTVYQIRIDIGKQDTLHADSPCLKIWHENQLENRIGNGPFFAFPFFEVNKFNERRRSHLSSADQIIVASDWAKGVLVDNDIKESELIHVVECGVDRTIFNDSNSTNNNEKCIFFNCGKWEVRKGHDVLHKAFADAFSENDNVELWMMTDNPFLTQEEKNSWLSQYDSKQIKLIDRVQYQHELSNIMKQTYCGVFPSRAEGWNLEALEMMSSGKQVIITNYSAHTQFCNADNSLLIDIEEEEPAYDGKWFVGENGTWASLDGLAYDQLVQHLKDVYNQWKKKPIINEAGIETSKVLSWERATEKISTIMLGE